MATTDMAMSDMATTRLAITGVPGGATADAAGASVCTQPEGWTDSDTLFVWLMLVAVVFCAIVPLALL